MGTGKGSGKCVESERRRGLLKKTGAIGITGTTGLAGCLGMGTGSDEDHGEPVEEIEFLIPNQAVIENVGRSLSNQWEGALGLSINRNVIDFTTWLDRIFSADPDFEEMTIWTWTSAPERVSPAFILETLTSDSNSNAPGYENSEYDELYAEMLAAFDDTERSAIIENMQEILLEDVPVIEFFRQPEINPTNTTKWNTSATELLGSGTAAVQTHHTATPNPDAFGSEALTLDVGTETRWDRPNPLNVTSGTLSAAMSHVFDPLRRFNVDGQFENWAVEEFEQIADDELQLTMREGMTFHDGEPVTSSDLAFSLNMFSETDFPKYAGFAASIEEATVEDDRTVRVAFEEPDSTFLEAGALILRIVPEHIWSDVLESDENPVNYNMPIEEMIGSGPFEIAQLDDTQIVFEATDDHWSNPEYDSWRQFSYEGSEALRASVVAGDVDMLDQSPTADLANAAADASEDVEVVTSSGLYWFNVALDNQDGPTSDRVLRRALLKTVNAQEIKATFFDGLGDIANGTLIHPQLDIGGDFPTLDEIFDVEGARSDLAEAGYTWDSDDQLRYPTG